MPPYTKKPSTAPSWSVYDGSTEIVGRIPTEYQADATIKKLNEAYAAGLKDGQDAPEPPDTTPVEPPPVDPPPVEPPPPTGETVQANPSNFSTVLSSASGKTVVLADGNYGALSLKGRVYSALTRVRAANRHKAVFSSVLLNNCANMEFDGIQVTSDTFRADYGAHHIYVRNALLRDGYYAMKARDLGVYNCDISGGANAAIFNVCYNFSLEESDIHDVVSDLVRVTGNSYNFRIVNNNLRDSAATTGVHPDAIQMFGADNFTPHDFVIRGNYIYDNPATGGAYQQGIFLSDPLSPTGYYNVTVEENLIGIGSPNSIFMKHGLKNVVIRSNTLLSYKVGGGGASIRLIGPEGNRGTIVENNIMSKLIDETKDSVIRNNFLYSNDAASPAFYGKLFQGEGKATQWQHFLPKPGSPIDFGTLYGAQKRLKELQAG